MDEEEEDFYAPDEAAPQASATTTQPREATPGNGQPRSIGADDGDQPMMEEDLEEGEEEEEVDESDSV